MPIKDWSIPGADDQPIWGDTHLPSQGVDPKAVLLLCHGFKGYKDYGFMPVLAEQAAQRCGVIAHRFNFSHSGMTNQVQTFERPDLFEKDTWGKQVHDVLTVSEAVLGGRLPGGARGRIPLFWFGHSRGGVTSLLAAARLAGDPAIHDRCPPLTGVIAAAAPSWANGFDSLFTDQLRRQGYIETKSFRTGQILRIGKGWLDEIEQDPQSVDPKVAIGHVSCPVLLIHGDDDTTVPLDAAHRLMASAGDQAELHVIAGASHTFNAPNPLPLDQPPPPQTQEVIDRVYDFIDGIAEIPD